MRDAIDRQAAIETAIEAADEWDGGYNEERERVIRGALEALPSAHQWIPCSERLPNANGIYIVTRKISDGFECQNITDACYFDGSNTWHDDTRVNHERKYLADVLAWMPLPEPYREDEDETETD